MERKKEEELHHSLFSISVCQADERERNKEREREIERESDVTIRPKIVGSFSTYRILGGVRLLLGVGIERVKRSGFVFARVFLEYTFNPSSNRFNDQRQYVEKNDKE